MTHPEIIARDLVCDVVDKLCEEGDLEQLIQCDELEIGDTLSAERGRRWPIWQCTMCAILDGDLAVSVWVWESILEWKVVTIR